MINRDIVKCFPLLASILGDKCGRRSNQAILPGFGNAGRCGKLDTAKLHRIYVGNGRVFRRPYEQKGLNTALHILFDCSYSMYGEGIAIARKSCLALVTALLDVKGINLGLTAFLAEDGKESVCPLLRHGEKKRNVPTVSAFGDTPLGAALWWVMGQMQALKEDRKIILIISDGCPTSPNAARIAIEQCRKMGIELFGIGIQSRALEWLLGKGGTTIDSFEELAPAMFEAMRKALIGG